MLRIFQMPAMDRRLELAAFKMFKEMEMNKTRSFNFLTLMYILTKVQSQVFTLETLKLCVLKLKLILSQKDLKFSLPLGTREFD